MYAAVSFSSSEGDKDVHSILGGCRLFRIDQLTSSSANQLPSPFQLTPKKLKLPSACKALAMSVDHSGITVILSTSNGIIRCANVSLLGGVVSEKGYFPQIQMNYFTKQNKLKLHSMVIICNIQYVLRTMTSYSCRVCGYWKMKMVDCFLFLRITLVELRIFLS